MESHINYLSIVLETLLLIYKVVNELTNQNKLPNHLKAFKFKF